MLECPGRLEVSSSEANPVSKDGAEETLMKIRHYSYNVESGQGGIRLPYQYNFSSCLCAIERLSL